MKIGVYCIICLVNQKSYIGQSSNIKQRWARHRYDLKNNIHKNKELQSDYNMYGKECLSFNILEVCEKEDLLDKENFWISKYDSINKYKGFNYTCNTNPRQDDNVISKNRKTKSIQVYKEEDLIATYESIAECARQMNLSKKKIQECCSGKMYFNNKSRKTYKGFIFKYL